MPTKIYPEPAQPGAPVTSDLLDKMRQESKRALLTADVEAMSKRLKDAEKRNVALEKLVAQKDQHIEALLNIILEKSKGAPHGAQDAAPDGS